MPVLGPQMMGRGAGFQITQSCRFNDGDSAYLSRTPSASNRDTWTFSAWVKRGNISGADYYLFSAGSDNDNMTSLWFTATTDKLRYRHEDASSITDDVVTTPVFRDPTAWYHVVLAVDTTQGTAADRVLIYVNGVRITALDTANYPDTSIDTDVNAAVEHNIGRRRTAVGTFFDGYMAEVIFVDGQQLTPSDFGQFDTINPSVWKPKPYAGTFGTSGYRLDFANAADLGNDVSGNANDWTANGLATDDQVPDSPTENYCVWNSIEEGASGVVFANGNLRATTGAGGDGTARGTLGAASGKWVFEIEVVSVLDVAFGIGNADIDLTASNATLGGKHYLYRDDGNKIVNGVASAYGASFTTADGIRVEVDLDGGSIEFFKNNASQGSITITETGETWFPVGSSTGASDAWIADFGQQGFSHTPTAGFKALTTKTLPAVDVRQPQKFFAPVLYTGTGAELAVTGVGLSPDLVWHKGRSGATSHNLWDTDRTATKYLEAETAAAEATDTQGLKSFDADGFTVGTKAAVNTSSATYVAWCLKELAGFFDIVAYVGDGNASQAVSHALGVVPGMMIVKSRDAASNWGVYHENVAADPETDVANLDTGAAFTDSAAAWNDTAPASNQLTVGSSFNPNTENMIAYLFGEKSGLSAIGSYTGNASTDGPFVYCGFRPAFVLVKEILGAADSWVMLDAARDPSNRATTRHLIADFTNIESDSSGRGHMDFLATGFKPRTTNTETNSAVAYLFIAFAEAGIGANVAPPNAR